MMYAQIMEFGSSHAEHEITRNSEGTLVIQDVPMIQWVYQVARDCLEIDEVRIYNGEVYVSFDIDRKCEPAKVTVQAISSDSLDLRLEQGEEISDGGDLEEIDAIAFHMGDLG